MSLDWESKLAIQETIVLYAELCDTRQLDRVADTIFTEDATIDYGTGKVAGRAAIHAFFTSHHAVIGTSHNVSNFLIAGDGDEARCTSHVLAWHWFGEGPEDLARLHAADTVAVGRYEDELVRLQGRWRIRSRFASHYGTGVGIGSAEGPVREILTGTLARAPRWPLPGL